MFTLIIKASLHCDIADFWRGKGQVFSFCCCLYFFTKLYTNFEFCVFVNYCMLPKLFPGCCIEVACCFWSGEWVCLSLLSLLIYHSHLCLMFISFNCITQSNFTVACIKYCFQERKDAISYDSKFLMSYPNIIS